MSKYLYFQDYHITGKNSVHYIGDYFTDCLLMLDEILEIGKEHKVDALLDGGDTLHTSEPTYRILDEICDRIEKAEIPIYSLLGNHSARYHSMEHSRYTGMMHLIKRSKYFNYLGSKFQTTGAIFKGIEYSHDVEENLKNDGIKFNDKYKDFWKIVIVHAFICPKEFPFASHAICDDIKTNADIVLVAHYHSEWEKQVGSTLYKDIGCVGRRSITEKDIKPSVLLIDTDKREIKEIFLKSAKPGNEIFDISKVDEMKANNNNLDEFKKMIEDVQFQEMRIQDTVKYIAKEKNIDKKPVDLILNKIGELDDTQN